MPSPADPGILETARKSAGISERFLINHCAPEMGNNRQIAAKFITRGMSGIRGFGGAPGLTAVPLFSLGSLGRAMEIQLFAQDGNRSSLTEDDGRLIERIESGYYFPLYSTNSSGNSFLRASIFGRSQTRM